MRQLNVLAPLLKFVTLGILLSACGNAPGESVADGPYSDGSASPGGTGRYYMGREIAHVMSYKGADWLERSTREREERADLSVARLPLGENAAVADIGAGSGYFSRRIARRVPDGTVFAVDIQPEMLAILEQNAAAEGIGNIQTVLAAEKSLNLAPASIDLALFVDVYHELSWPREIMLDLVDSLKAGGKVVLLEYRAEDPSIQIIPVHKMTSAQVILEMEQVGLELVENGDFLPQQHFLVFRKPNAE
jgi:SAM-dependent methyltransferase